MTVQVFDRQNRQHRHDAALILAEAFPHCYEENAVQEVEECLAEENIAVCAVENGRVVGFAGAMPHYDGNVFEVHPVAVLKAFQGKGIGRAMLEALEKACAETGAVTMYLGCDDEFGQTSLSGCDIYEDLYERIQTIRNHVDHPYSFYEKCGYRIVGVVPDANGYGKPDIMMAKRIAKAQKLTDTPAPL